MYRGFRSSLLKRRVTKIVTGLSDGDKSQNRLIPFWCFVKEILNEPEIQRFDLLSNIRNDYGRGKAWLRASINERCLEKYMHLCINNENLINRFYEKWAFMSNTEKNSILPITAAGWYITLTFYIKLYYTTNSLTYYLFFQVYHQ